MIKQDISEQQKILDTIQYSISSGYIKDLQFDLFDLFDLDEQIEYIN